MLKTIRRFLCVMFVAAAPPIAIAGVGQTPAPGYVLPDGNWLLGLSEGVNNTYQYGISAAGSTQAGATQLPSQKTLVEVDTVASGAGVALPSCLVGTEISLYNNGANTLTVYPTVSNNPVTGAQDTINNSTSLSLSSHAPEYFFCANNGNWAAK